MDEGDVVYFGPWNEAAQQLLGRYLPTSHLLAASGGAEQPRATKKAAAKSDKTVRMVCLFCFLLYSGLVRRREEERQPPRPRPRPSPTPAPLSTPTPHATQHAVRRRARVQDQGPLFAAAPGQGHLGVHVGGERHTVI